MAFEDEIVVASNHDPIADWFVTPRWLITYCVLSALLALIYPAFLLLLSAVLVFWLAAYSARRDPPPLRLPFDANMIDESLTRETAEEKRLMGLRWTNKTYRVSPADGVMFMGHERGKPNAQEIWLTMADLLRHAALVGTTGSGKTEVLLSWYVHAVLHSSGDIYMDGKADVRLPFIYWCLARRWGREEDVYFVNLLTGSEDKHQQIIDNTHRKTRSNTVNLFGTASPTFIIQLVESMLPQAGSEGAMWQESAKSLIEGLINALCHKRARGELLLSQQSLKEYLPLPNLVALYNEALKNNWHKEGYMSLESYLANLPGFQLALREQPEKWDADAFKQHGFRSMQFLKTLALFTETYGHVFPEDSGDIVMQDILHNQRLLCVMIPSTELSRGETTTLGNLFINMLRMNVSRDLGSDIEGMAEDVLLAEAKKARFPFLVQADELGQYFAPGLDTLMAQMRSLKYSGEISTQDIPGLERSAKSETASVLGNTRLKYCLSIEDPGKTFEVFRDVMGQGAVAEVSQIQDKSGMFSSAGQVSDTYHVKDKDRITMRELRGMAEGEGVMSLEDRLVRSRAFYIPDEEKISKTLSVRINRFVEVLPPTTKTVMEIYPALIERKPLPFDSRISGISTLWEGLEKIHAMRKYVPPEEIGICLFEYAAEFFAQMEAMDAPCYAQEPEEEFHSLL